MKVISYNILSGAYPSGKAQDRFDDLADFLEEQEPDILALCECNGWQEQGSKRLYQLEQRLGMRGFLAEAQSGFHVALFLKNADLLGVHPYQNGFMHAALRVSAEINGNAYELIAAHLNPFSGEARLIEAARLAAFCHPERQVLLMGDLNAMAPQTLSDSLEGLEARRRVRHEFRGVIDTRAIELLNEAGFRDCAAIWGDCATTTMPTALVDDGTYSPMRLDYILTSPALAKQLSDYEVLRDKRCEQLSDHYPVRAIFDE